MLVTCDIPVKVVTGVVNNAEVLVDPDIGGVRDACEVGMDGSGDGNDGGG